MNELPGAAANRGAHKIPTVVYHSMYVCVCVCTYIYIYICIHTDDAYHRTISLSLSLHIYIYIYTHTVYHRTMYITVCTTLTPCGLTGKSAGLVSSAETQAAQARRAGADSSCICIRPISLLRLSLLRFVDSEFPGNPLRT